MRAMTVAAAVRLGLLAGSMAGAMVQPALGQGVPADEELDEVVVSGRQQSAAAQVLEERIELPVPMDIVAAEQIARVGDSTVSTALRRLPGVTLVGDQFIYVRGLGERYSSTTLNGAYVPSPDLTRNVIPLDLFPADIIHSLSVSKGYTVNQPAAFGGGNVDIRTVTVPDAAVVRFKVGTGWNDGSSDDGLTYRGGGRDWLGTDNGTRALPAALQSAIQTYRGDLAVPNIYQTLLLDGQPHTLAEAEEINRQLALSLNRDFGVQEKAVRPDLSVETALGNTWRLGAAEDWRFGVLGLVDYGDSWRNRERRYASASDPDVIHETMRRSVRQVALTGSLNLGLEFTRDHSVKATGLYLRNTDDETSITTGFDRTTLQEDGRGFRHYGIRFEERELELAQFGGRHVLGTETLLRLPALDNALLRDLAFNWYYSDAVARSDIPNEVTIAAQDEVDPLTGQMLSTGVPANTSAADIRFSALRDDVQSYGWSLEKPFEFQNWSVKFNGGWDYVSKARSFQQANLALGATSAALPGNSGEVFTDDNILNPAYGFRLFARGGEGFRQSYLAGEAIDAYFGQFDLNWAENWRLSAGWRREYFQRVSVPIDPLAFGLYGQGVFPLPRPNPGESEADYTARVRPILESLYTAEKGDYPAAALTWKLPDFWAERFQLRFGWSRTTARPDLREVSDSFYIDPFTETRVVGNPLLRTARLDNYDLRAEWFFSGGDNFTVSLFYKDIANPIESVETPGSDGRALTFVNGQSAKVQGVEVEWLKRLGGWSGFLGDWADRFFVSGNLMYADSEIKVSGAGLTNPVHPLSQASDWVANVQVGYDSLDGRHAASLVYNGTGKRLFFAGLGTAPDAYEQPFSSLDLVYSFFPSKSLTLKLRAQNLLGDDITIRRGGVTTLSQKLGRTVKLDATIGF